MLDGIEVFKLKKRIVILDVPELQNFCMQFDFQTPDSYFKEPKGVKFSNTLIFAKPTEIISYNYDHNEIKVLTKFELPLKA